MEGDQYPKGFLGSVAEAAIKRPGRHDLGLVFTEVPAVAAGVFTQNKVKAAPLLIDMERLRSHKARAILANSGNANACTGEDGIKDALLISDALAQKMGIPSEEVLLASTGVIGQRLPVQRILDAIPRLSQDLSPSGLYKVAMAIMTTDKFPKIAIRKGAYSGQDYTIFGMAKGAGMIMPNMATMLCFILTDLMVEKEALQSALKKGVGSSFNAITVDGDTSTNDMVLVLANGLAGNRPLDREGISTFEGLLLDLMKELSRMIVKDGEGATKLVNIKVVAARSPKEAEEASRAVANSLLVKTAFFGADPNWGRIMAAIGRSACEFNPEMVDIYIDDVQIVQSGIGLGKEAEAEAKLRMEKAEFQVLIDLKSGIYEYEILTSDLTYEYVKINAEYRT